MHVYQCAECGKWCEGAAWHLPEHKPQKAYWLPEDPAPEMFCSPECRDRYQLAARSKA